MQNNSLGYGIEALEGANGIMEDWERGFDALEGSSGLVLVGLGLLRRSVLTVFRLNNYMNTGIELRCAEELLHFLVSRLPLHPLHCLLGVVPHPNALSIPGMVASKS